MNMLPGPDSAAHTCLQVVPLANQNVAVLQLKKPLRCISCDKKCKTAQTAEGVFVSLVSLISAGLSESGDAGKPASFHLTQPHRPGQQRRTRMKKK